MDEDGYTSIVQRKKDMIIVDGFNVYPSEVESVLYAHPAVRLAAVIGVPDKYHGEIVKACIALKPGATATADEVIAHCRDEPHRIQGAAARRNPRHAADERGRQDPLPRAARRTRARPASDIMTHRRRRAASMSGLEFFQQMIAGEMPPPPMLELLGIRLVEVEAGRVVFTADGRGALLQRHRRRARRLRGDAARHGARLRDQLGDAGGRRFTTLELKVNLTRPLTREVGAAALRSEGRPRRRPHRHVRRPHRRRRRQALRPRHDDVHHRRAPRGRWNHRRIHELRTEI